MTSFIESWLQECDISSTSLENPYFTSARSLLTVSKPTNVTLGTGHSVISSICDTILSTCKHELILVTCFWAKSTSLDSLARLLLALSAKALAQGSKIRVRLCFSSLSLLQKLFHTQSPAGRTWQPQEWASKLGLPPPEQLRGLDLNVKSIFMLPISVMHPKLMIIDRKSVFLPSCNVSWEPWFEGAVKLKGPVVEKCFLRFFEGFWCQGDEDNPQNVEGSSAGDRDPEAGDVSIEALRHGTQSSHGRPLATSTSGTLPAQFSFPSAGEVPTLFLPSQYHRNPQFRLPWQPAANPPMTPLNSFLLHLFALATSSIFLQTPNITSPPVLAAVVSALERGVSVTIVTNERLMLVEQLVTAGTTTTSCVSKLVSSHRRLCSQCHEPQELYQRQYGRPHGRLHISYFSSRPGQGEQKDLHPVSSHLKMTVVDDELLVLGSGNMDRASWYTSQELGVAFASQEMASVMLDQVKKVDSQYCKVFYDG